MENTTSIATKNGNERPISSNETSTLVMDEFRMENITSIATKDEKEHPLSSNETSAFVMDELREKVGFVTFVKSGFDDERDEESTENRNVLQSGWPAVIFDSIKDFDHHKVNLKNKLSNKAAISEADTDILNYRKKLFQARQRIVNHRPVAFLLDVDLLPKKRQRLIFDDETNVLFTTTVEAWHYLKDNYATSNIASAPFQVDARNSKMNQGATVLRDVSNEMGIPTSTETKKRKGHSTYNLREKFRKIQNTVDAGDTETLAKGYMATVFGKKLCAKIISGTAQLVSDKESLVEELKSVKEVADDAATEPVVECMRDGSTSNLQPGAPVTNETGATSNGNENNQGEKPVDYGHPNGDEEDAEVGDGEDVHPNRDENDADVFADISLPVDEKDEAFPPTDDDKGKDEDLYIPPADDNDDVAGLKREIEVLKESSKRKIEELEEKLGKQSEGFNAQEGAQIDATVDDDNTDDNNFGVDEEDVSDFGHYEQEEDVSDFGHYEQDDDNDDDDKNKVKKEISTVNNEIIKYDTDWKKLYNKFAANIVPIDESVKNMIMPVSCGKASSEYVQWNKGKLHTPHLLTFGQLVLSVGSKEAAHILLAQLCRLFVVPKLTELTCIGCMKKFTTSPVALSIHQERGCLVDPPSFQFESGDQMELLYTRRHHPVFFMAIDSILMLARSPSFDKPLDVLTLGRCGCMPLSSVVRYCKVGKDQVTFERGLMKWQNGDSLEGRITFMGMMLKNVTRDKSTPKRTKFVYPGPDDTALEVLPFVQPYSKFPDAYMIKNKKKKSLEYHKMTLDDTINACMDEIEKALVAE